MPNCTVCKKMALEKPMYSTRQYCKKHFCELIEKRVRKYIRLHKLIDPKKSYSLKDDGSASFALTKYILEDIYQGRLKFNDKGIAIISWSLELEIKEKLDAMMTKKPFPKKEKTIKLLIPITEEEIETFATIKKFTFKKKPMTKIPLIDSIQKKHDETKFSLLKSFQYIEEHTD